MSEKVNINIFDMLAAMAMDNVAAEQKAKASLRNLETLAMPGDPAIGLAERKKLGKWTMDNLRRGGDSLINHWLLMQKRGEK
jgi:hypothetical protein